MKFGNRIEETEKRREKIIRKRAQFIHSCNTLQKKSIKGDGACNYLAAY